MVREELIIKKALLTKSPADGSLTTLSRGEMEKRGLVPAKPLKSYPVSIAVPGHSQLVPRDLKLPSGTKLEACYAGKWNPITTLSENQDGTLNVRWDDYGAVYDCSMAREELIIKRTVVQKLQEAPENAAAPADKAPELRTWTDSTGQHTVRAALVNKSDTTVTLRTDAGRDLTLPIAKLSEADREFLRSTP
jgi:hypothetical protein